MSHVITEINTVRKLSEFGLQMASLRTVSSIEQNFVTFDPPIQIAEQDIDDFLGQHVRFNKLDDDDVIKITSNTFFISSIRTKLLYSLVDIEMNTTHRHEGLSNTMFEITVHHSLEGTTYLYFAQPRSSTGTQTMNNAKRGDFVAVYDDRIVIGAEVFDIINKTLLE